MKSSKFSIPKRGWIVGSFLIIVISGIILWMRFQSSSEDSSFVYLKSPCPDFIGREKYLCQLHNDLISSSNSGALRLKVLWGKGGYGKTELAIAFGNRYREYFSSIWTFYCDNPESLKQGYRDLADRLGILNPADSFIQLREKVHFFLENQNPKRPWLLIYDNVEDGALDYPQRGGIVLITSQKKMLNPAFILEVQPLLREESIQLLENITHENRSDSMESLIQNFEGIPLLINYAAHYIRATPGASIAEYHRLFSHDNLLKHEQDVNRRYLKSLTSSWQLTLSYLEKENPLALQFLYACSYLYPEDIQEGWIEDWLKIYLGEDKEYPWQKQKKEILKSLMSFGVIHYHLASKTFSLHRFFQSMIRESRKDYTQEDLGQSVALLLKHAKDYDFFNTSSWKVGENWYIHTSELKKWLDQLPGYLCDDKTWVDKVCLYETIGAWCLYNYHFQKAIDITLEAMEIRKQFQKQPTYFWALDYSCIGWCLNQQGKPREALKYYSLADQIHQVCTEPNPDERAETLNAKGLALFFLGEFEEAIACYQQALEINLKQQGKEDILVAGNISNMGRCYNNLGRFEEGMSCYQQAIELKEKTCGKQHPYYLWSWSGYASASITLRGPKQALKQLHDSLAQYNKLNGEEHGELGNVWNRIGIAQFYDGKYSQARASFKKGRVYGLKYFGKDSNINAVSYLGQAWCWIREKKTKKGLSCYLKYLSFLSKRQVSPQRMRTILEDFQQALLESKRVGCPPEYINKAAKVAVSTSEKFLGEEDPLTYFFMQDVALLTSSSEQGKEVTFLMTNL